MVSIIVPEANYNPIAVVCQGQTETEEPDAMFVLEPGATLSNVIIGASQAEGVHCRGPWFVFRPLLLISQLAQLFHTLHLLILKLPKLLITDIT